MTFLKQEVFDTAHRHDVTRDSIESVFRLASRYIRVSPKYSKIAISNRYSHVLVVELSVANSCSGRDWQMV